MAFKGSVPKVDKTKPKFSNGHWLFPEQMGDPPYTGFVYIIHDLYLNRAYIGKKSFISKSPAHGTRESDWKTYVSSSTILKEFLKIRPKEEFNFICLEQYKTKGTLSYAETWSACIAEVPTSTVFYNTRIEKVSWSVTEPISERHKERLFEVLQKMKRG